MKCGVRQGCLLSPLLFIICIEILCLWIRNDKDVEGISIFNSNSRLCLYADDVTMYLKNEKDIFKVCIFWIVLNHFPV